MFTKAMLKKIDKATKRMNNWSTSGKCPICKQIFKSASCKHSVTEVRDRLKRNIDNILTIETIEKVARDVVLKMKQNGEI